MRSGPSGERAVSIRRLPGGHLVTAALSQSTAPRAGFVVDRQDLSGDGMELVMLSGTRSDVQVFISMSLVEVSNVGDQVVLETVVSLSWAPMG
jgi:hypothetical protein